MEKVLVLAISITILFGVMKFVEMKYLDCKLKPLKDVIRDLVMVFGSSFVCSFGLVHYQQTFDDFLNVITNTSHSPIIATTQVFTGAPEF
jgi:hypothetical protein